MENKTGSSAEASAKAGKYFKYAIGEIVLVVIGILIALSINNWNEDRKDHLKEAKLKSELVKEFEKDLEQLESKIKIRKLMVESGLKLLEYLDQGIYNDSIKYHMSYLTFRPTFDPITVEFIDKSEIGLIKNDSLRRMLTAWKVEVIQLREDELNWRDYVFTYRYNHEFESESGFQRELQIEFNKNNGSKLFLLDRDSISHSKLNSPNKEIDYLKMLQNPFWDTFCTRAIQSGQDANLNSIVLKKRITTILELLNKKDD